MKLMVEKRELTKTNWESLVVCCNFR